jgi:hypothetical protein
MLILIFIIFLDRFVYLNSYIFLLEEEEIKFLLFDSGLFETVLFQPNNIIVREK